MHYELRPKTQVLKTGTLIKAWHFIEIRQGKKWTLLGDDTGLLKYPTAEERDAKMASLRLEIAQADVHSDKDEERRTKDTATTTDAL